LRPDISGTYEITIAGDDGIRLFVDGKLLISHWSNHAVEARMAKIDLQAGKFYNFTMEFYEDGGDAAALMGWMKPNEDELTAAVSAAKNSEVAIIFAGNSQHQESEGFDRQSIDLRRIRSH
jgi:beta-glucosidase